MKKIIGFIFVVFVCFGIKSCMARNSINEASNSNHTSNMSKLKKKRLKIYSVNVTGEKVECDGDNNDCSITISGYTDVPNGSIVYAQGKENGDANLAYGNNEDATDTKVKNHRISFLVLTSNLFNLDNIKVGQKANLKIYCTNQNFEYSLDDSELISKKVRNKVANTDIKPYTVEVTKKMVYVAEHY